MPNRPKELDDPDRREVSASGYTRGAVTFGPAPNVDAGNANVVFFKCTHHPRYKCPRCGTFQINFDE